MNKTRGGRSNYRNYGVGGGDPRDFQLRDLQRRVTKAERKLERAFDKIDRIVSEYDLDHEVLQRIVASLKPVLPPPGEATR